MSVGHLGPALPAEQATAWVSSHWSAQRGAAYYDLAWFQRGAAPTGFTKVVSRREVATVHAEFGSVTPDRGVWRLASPSPAGGFDPVYGFDLTIIPVADVTLPGKRTEYFNTGGTAWSTLLWQLNPDGFVEADLSSPRRAYRAGQTYRESFNHAVFGPVRPEVGRDGNFLSVDTPLFGDSAGSSGGSIVDSASTVLYRDGRKIGEQPVPGGGFFEVPAEPATTG